MKRSRWVIASLVVCSLLFVQASEAQSVYYQVASSTALWFAKKTAVREAIGVAVAAGGGAATASSLIKLITSATGWGSIAVVVGLGLLEYYYSAADKNALYTAASNSGGCYAVASPISGNFYGGSGTPPCPAAGSSAITINSLVPASTSCGLSASSNGYSSWDLTLSVTYYPAQNSHCGTLGACGAFYNFPSESYSAASCSSKPHGYCAQFSGYDICLLHGLKSATAAWSPTVPVTGPSASQVVDYLAANPSSSLAPEQKQLPLGLTQAGVPVTALTADSVSTATADLIDSSWTTTTTPNSSQVIVATTPTAPTTPVTTTPNPSPTSTTTTTTTNPDGSTTTTTTDTATVTCAGTAAETRTAGGVYATHRATWLTSPLLGGLAAWASITFPSTLPTTTLTSSHFGNHSIDWSTFSWVFTAIKIILIGGTGFVAYRIVFGGG